MKIEFTHHFIKIFKKRFAHLPQVKEKFYQKTRLFEKNPSYSILKDHQLSGKMKGFRTFSITGDVRVVYYIYKNIAYFVDIGTHNQVY